MQTKQVKIPGPSPIGAGRQHQFLELNNTNPFRTLPVYRKGFFLVAKGKPSSLLPAVSVASDGTGNKIGNRVAFADTPDPFGFVHKVQTLRADRPKI